MSNIGPSANIVPLMSIEEALATHNKAWARYQELCQKPGYENFPKPYGDPLTNPWYPVGPPPIEAVVNSQEEVFSQMEQDMGISRAELLKELGKVPDPKPGDLDHLPRVLSFSQMAVSSSSCSASASQAPVEPGLPEQAGSMARGEIMALENVPHGHGRKLFKGAGTVKREG